MSLPAETKSDRDARAAKLQQLMGESKVHLALAALQRDELLVAAARMRGRVEELEIQNKLIATREKTGLARLAELEKLVEPTLTLATWWRGLTTGYGDDPGDALDADVLDVSTELEQIALVIELLAKAGIV